MYYEVLGAVFEHPPLEIPEGDMFRLRFQYEEDLDQVPFNYKVALHFFRGEDKAELVASGSHTCARDAMSEVLARLCRSLGWADIKTSMRMGGKGNILTAGGALVETLSRTTGEGQ